MRALILGAAVLFCAAAIGWNAWTAYGPPVWIPHLTCDRPEFDFGERPTSSYFTHAFDLRNSGGAPLIVQDITTTCGCIAVVEPDVSELPLLVRAGESFRVGVTIDLEGQAGAVQRVVAVRSDDPRNPVVRLEVRGLAGSRPNAER